MLNSRKIHSLLLFTIIYNVLAVDNKAAVSSSVTESSSQQQLDLTLPSTDSKKQKSRMRKTHNKNQRKIFTYRDMTYDELKVAKNQQIANNSYSTAIKYIEQMLKFCSDITIIGELLLEIADLYVMDDQHEKAAKKYAEYVTFYPGGDRIEYALFKAIENSFECTLSYDRDQTKTEETLALAESFLKQDHLTTYITEVTAIRDKCYKKLAESELNICSFYLQRGRLKPAEKRIDDIRTIWLPKLPEIEALIDILEADLVAQKAEREQKTLVTQNNTTKKHMAERF